MEFPSTKTLLFILFFAMAVIEVQAGRQESPSAAERDLLADVDASVQLLTATHVAAKVLQEAISDSQQLLWEKVAPEAIKIITDLETLASNRTVFEELRQIYDRLVTVQISKALYGEVATLGHNYFYTTCKTIFDLRHQRKSSVLRSDLDQLRSNNAGFMNNFKLFVGNITARPLVEQSVSLIQGMVSYDVERIKERQKDVLKLVSDHRDRIVRAAKALDRAMLVTVYAMEKIIEQLETNSTLDPK